MKKLCFYFSFFILLSVIAGCSSTKSVIIPQKPETGKAVLVGAVLVENDGIDDLYQSKTANIMVVLVGKSVMTGTEEIQGYRLKTDKNGYFILQNVPPGTYVLRGIEVDIGYTNRFLISSRWEGNRQVYIYEDKMIDYNVRYWPEGSNSQVIDLGINYFRLDNAGRIYNDRFKFLKNTTPGIKDFSYNMPAPSVYFKDNYPALEWFIE